MVKAVAALLLVAVPAFAGGGPKRVTKEHVSIEVPDGWTVVEPPREGTLLAIQKTPKESDAVVPATIEVGLLPMPPEVQKAPLEEIGRYLAMSSMKDHADTVVEMDFQTTRISKRPAVEWAYRFTEDVGGKKVAQRMHVAMLRNGTNSYLIAYHGPLEGPDESSDLANEVIHSVVVEK